MTGEQQDADRRLVEARVELLGDATIRLEEVDHDPERFSIDLVTRAFTLGLLIPPDREPEPVRRRSFLQVVLDGEARFLVGEVDLGVEVGMGAVTRGLEYAVHSASTEAFAGDPGERHTAARKPTAANASDRGVPVRSERGSDEPADAELPDRTEIQVPIDEAVARLPDLLDELRGGARVVLVDRGARVAVLMSWSSYADLRTQLAAASVAFWTAWRTGVFDVAGYATDVTAALHGSGAKPDRFAVEGDDPVEGGDDDERTR